VERSNKCHGVDRGLINVTDWHLEWEAKAYRADGNGVSRLYILVRDGYQL